MEYGDGSQDASNGIGQPHHNDNGLQNGLNVRGTAGPPAERNDVQENGNGQQEPLGPDEAPIAPPFRGRMTDLNRRTSTLSRRQMVRCHTQHKRCL